MDSRAGTRLRESLERRQIALYLAALAAGFLAGAAVPGSQALDLFISPAIALLLYATFLAVPFTRIRAGLLDLRFLGLLMVLNFVLVPVLVFALSRFVAHDAALLTGVLLVLLAPCIDYVIVFSALGGAAHGKLLAATPLLMIAQLLLLPFFLWLFTSGSVTGIIAPEPLLEALVLLILLPLAAAAATQLLADRRPSFRRAAAAGNAAMVPLMLVVLFTVAASQARRVLDAGAALAALVPLYAVFLAVMVLIGALTGHAGGLDYGSARALAFSGATRNSLVVLPLALALPEAAGTAAAAVVTQTFTELAGMALAIRCIPRLLPQPAGRASGPDLPAGA
ncbi:bile acid:sodium symporter [Arthrobacter koreensis]|uniref:bile acid:sodium symporter n=1 Tax=Arthrobacter koreensis TaxID=199136 RepID=UPI002DBA05DD|nr:bile acid:sodium symporter [Arthrobacter koreensis]MEB7503269.1 arsenic resistance protein [Arthrobacter koreensis]